MEERVAVVVRLQASMMSVENDPLGPLPPGWGKPTSFILALASNMLSSLVVLSRLLSSPSSFSPSVLACLLVSSLLLALLLPLPFFLLFSFLALILLFLLSGHFLFSIFPPALFCLQSVPMSRLVLPSLPPLAFMCLSAYY